MSLPPKHISGPRGQAPFLDVLGTMGDPSLPLTLEDREEWGDPVKHPQHRLSISSYCPVHNITPQVRKTNLSNVSGRLWKQAAEMLSVFFINGSRFVIP